MPRCCEPHGCKNNTLMRGSSGVLRAIGWTDRMYSSRGEDCLSEGSRRPSTRSSPSGRHLTMSQHRLLSQSSLAELPQSSKYSEPEQSGLHELCDSGLLQPRRLAEAVRTKAAIPQQRRVELPRRTCQGSRAVHLSASARHLRQLQ